MQFKRLTVLALAGLLSVTAVATVLADSPLTADEAVTARQAAMKADGKVLRGADGLTGDKAIAALQTVVDNYSKLPSLFPKDSITDKSLALPIIWTEFDKFSAIFKSGADAATDGIAAVRAGDMAKYKADVEAIAQTCNTCHMTYRQKKDG
jgi:cytochrome c556